MFLSRRFISILLTIALIFQLIPLTSVSSAEERPAPTKISQPAPIDFTEVNWDQEVILPSDGKTRRLREKEVMEHFKFPPDVQKFVLQHTKNGSQAVEGADELKNKIRRLGLPHAPAKTQQPAVDLSTLIDVRTAPKISVGNLIPHSLPEATSRVQKFELKPAPPRRSSEKYNYRPFDKSGRDSTHEPINQPSLWERLRIFFIPPALGQASVPLIEFYDGIEKNTMDYALYYLSQQQNDDGSFGKYEPFMQTAEIVNALAKWGRNDNDIFTAALDYLTNYTPENNHERAVKIRLLHALEQNYDGLISELLATKNSDGGYGFDANYASDALSTIEVLETLTIIEYNADNAPAQALVYLLDQVNDNGSMRFTAQGDSAYYLINRTLEALYAYREFTVGGVNVLSKITQLLNFLRDNYSEEEEHFLGTKDSIDEAMGMLSFTTYGTEQTKQNLIIQNLKAMQHSDGSFDGNVRSTLFVMFAMAQPDIVITDIAAQNALVNRSEAIFILTLKNQGYKKSTGSDLHTFIDNVKLYESLNLEAGGFALDPNREATLNFNIADTISMIGQTNVRFFIEPDQDTNYDNNWIEKNFSFAPPSNSAPALPIFYIAQKWDIGGSPALNVRWSQKADSNRAYYVVLWRTKGTNQWSYTDINNNVNGAFLSGAFMEGTVYEVTSGVLHQDYSTITFFATPTDVKVSATTANYNGTVTGFVTDNADRFAKAPTFGFGVIGNADEEGNFSYKNIPNGSSASHIDFSYYENLWTKFSIPNGGTNSAVRIFTRLKEDTVAPVINNFLILNEWDYIVTNQTEVTLQVSGQDNLWIKEADFYYWDPTENAWIYIATAPINNNSGDNYTWYIPEELLGTGFKLKAILRDPRGNESLPREWGPFEIKDGTPPKFTVISPNGGESWPLGSTQTITWTTQAAYSVQQVNIKLIYPSGPLNLQSNVTNTGSFTWNIPNDSYYAGNSIKIKIEGFDDVNYKTTSDESDSDFAIVDNSPSPKNPWNRPIVISDSAALNPSGGELQSVKISHEPNGTAHVVYRYLHDAFGEPRIITEQLIHQKKQGNSWTAPAVIYEKIWETDWILSGFRPIGTWNLVVDISGNPHIVWSTNAYGGCQATNSTEIYTMYSNNNGATWSNPQNISQNSTESWSPDFAFDDLGNLHVAWSDGVTRTAACGAIGAQKIFYKKKSVNNQQWIATQQLSISNAARYPQITVTPTNKIHIIYYDTTLNAIRQTMNNTGSWSAASNVVSGDMNSANLIDLGAALHYVYHHWYNDPALGGRSRSRYLFYNNSLWGNPEEIAPTQTGYNAEYPKIVQDTSGNPHVVFEQYQSGSSRRNLKWTVKRNNQWIAPRQINLSSQSAENNSSSISSTGGQLIGAVWIGGYARNKEVFYAEGDLTKEYIKPAPPANIQLEPRPSAIRIRWDPYTDVNGDFDHFAIYRSTEPQPNLSSLTPIAQFNEIATTQFLDRSVVLNTQYYYTVVALNADGLQSEPAVFSGPVAPQDQFFKITGAALMTTKSHFGSAGWADYDNDGDLDVLVTTTNNNKSSLYRNNGGNAFTLMKNMIPGILKARGISWADYDNDGDLDFFAATKSAKKYVYRNDNGRFVTITIDNSKKITESTAGSWADNDRDGDLDLFVTNKGYNNILYKNEGNGIFTRITDSVIENTTNMSNGVFWADYDNDGDSDLFVVKGNGQSDILIRNDNSGNWTTMTGPQYPGGDTANGFGASWGDYDNDDDLDLFVANAGPGDNTDFLYKNNGDGTFVKILDSPVVTSGGDSAGSGWADYDNDGDLDLFVANLNNQPNFLFNNNGDGTFTRVTAGQVTVDTGNSWNATWADYNNDGDVDLFVINNSQERFLYSNNGTDYHWINIALRGTTSNRSAIGARVKVKTTVNGEQRQQMQEVSNATGNGGHGGLNLEFGLGEATVIDEIRIEWPSGAIQTLYNIAVDQSLQIVEGQ